MKEKAGFREWTNRLPLEFDHAVYVNHLGNRDLASFDEARARHHYKNNGVAEGRICSNVKCRRDFIGLVPAGSSILEIGPFFSPGFTRPEANVFYLDVLSTEAMKKRAETINGARPDSIPDIDYVWQGERYTDCINRKFSVIYSSHNIEHQPCLVTYLHNLESVLEEDGAVFLVIPDKRYCFDHFFPETSLADVIQAWVEKRKKHSLKDVLEHRFFAAHNAPVRHWQGDHGVNRAILPLQAEQSTSFLVELERMRLSDDYTDVHAWKFTPSTFHVVLENLLRLKLVNLKVMRLYQTVRNSNEFYAVLVRGRT